MAWMVSQRVRFLGALACALSACGSPMVYPRTPDVHRGLNVSVRSNVSHEQARAKFSVIPGQMTRDGASTAEDLEEPFEGYSAASTRSYNTWARVIGALFSLEGGLGYGFSDTIGSGLWLSTELIGAELRLQALSERSGAPLSATLSLGAAHVGIIPSLSHDLLVEGFGGRGGLDLGIRVGRDELLLAAYASYIRRRRNFQRIPDDGRFHETPPGAFEGLMVRRDELKLSIPIGYALRGRRFALLLGLVPEWTLDGSLRRWRCSECGGIYRLDSFRQNFALYLTLGVEFWREPTEAR